MESDESFELMYIAWNIIGMCLNNLEWEKEYDNVDVSLMLWSLDESCWFMWKERILSLKWFLLRLVMFGMLWVVVVVVYGAELGLGVLDI